jgi:long-chain acyl-CoA synthetase
MGGQVWEKFYPKGVSWSEPLPPPVPVQRLPERAGERWPDRVACDFYDRHVTYAEWLTLSRRAAKGLRALGVGPGVAVGLHLPNSPHYLVAFFGVLLAGGRVVNFSPLYSPRELSHQLGDSEVEVMVTLDLPQLYPKVAGLKGEGKLRALVVGGLEDFLPVAVARAMAPAVAERTAGPGVELDFRALIDNDGVLAPPMPAPPPDEIAVLQYSGGTTGEPKGAMLTHGNLSTVVAMRDYWTSGTLAAGAESTVVVLPLFHVYGMSMVMLVAVIAGMTMILHLRFDAERTLADIAAKRPTLFSGVPTMYAALLQHPRAGEFDLGSLRYCSCGGAPLPREILQGFHGLTGKQIVEGYGLTEASPILTLSPIDGSARPGTVGLPCPNTMLEIVDLETGTRVLPAGEAGEVCARGPQVMKGYWKRPEATAAAFAGGRFHTGDIGILDADGFLTLVDRKKDMILSGGFNVFPRVIEEAIYEHPAVAEATVIGVPDPYRGEAAKAFIALKPGATLDFDELTRFLADKLGRHEMPAAMELRASLPKTPVGKLSKKELVAEERAKRGAALLPGVEGGQRG